MNKPSYWPIVGLMSATATVGYLCRVNVGTAGAMIMTEYGLTQVEFGRVFSAFLLGYTLFQIPSGIVADKIGPRKTLLYATALWVVLTVLCVTISLPYFGTASVSFMMFMSIRFLLGITAAPAYPAGAKGVSAWVPVPVQGRANGVVLCSIGIGSALTPPLVSYSMVEWGWRAALIISAIPAGLIALMWMRIREPETVTVVASTPESIKPETKAKGLWSRRYIFLVVSYATQGYVGYIFINWFYLYLVQERHFSLLSGAWASSMPWMLTTISIPLGGLIADRLMKSGEKMYILPMVAMCASGVFISIGAHTANAWIAATTLALATGLVLSAEGPFWTTAIRLNPDRSGTSGGIMNAGCNTAGMISPILTPWIASWAGWENALHMAAVLAIAGGLLWLGIGLRTRNSEF